MNKYSANNFVGETFEYWWNAKVCLYRFVRTKIKPIISKTRCAKQISRWFSEPCAKLPNEQAEEEQVNKKRKHNEPIPVSTAEAEEKKKLNYSGTKDIRQLLIDMQVVLAKSPSKQSENQVQMNNGNKSTFS